ncbi:sodium-dependent phosphate transport protein 2B-like [Ptychodera flava]|uniref:sodium-dependent phosphate transport protein 2B-like n=1 Tax=Ptychodera flava TaxID=63121 RepID=UPI00396A9934
MTVFHHEKASQVDFDDGGEYDARKKPDCNGNVNFNGKNVADYPLETFDALPENAIVIDIDIDISSKSADVVDPYDVFNEAVPYTGKPWSELTASGKFKRVVIAITKICILTGLLYLFICSLDVMGSAFTLIGGTAAGEAISDSEILNNPFAGLMIGVLVTVLVQSSSTSTSLIVSMVAANILSVRQAIPMVMGANIGTSVTNTIVSVGQAGDRLQFRRAFAGATVHDCFNWLCVIILLPIEIATGYLYRLSSAVVGLSDGDANEDLDVDFLKVITKPFTNLIIQLDKGIINKIALGELKSGEVSLVKRWCDTEDIYIDVNVTKTINGTNVTLPEEVKNYTIYIERCNHLFASNYWEDAIIGVVLLVISLTLMIFCLIMIVKLLHSLLRGSVAKIVKKVVNADFPGKLSFLTGYLAILVGAGLTILVQSSSIFTSTLTPLIGVGVVSLKRAYPLTLGANIGTTVTGLLAALASADATDFIEGLQIALCHLFFNISGILIWYPIPLLRRVPIALAKKLGNTTAKYRWFAIFYLIIMFFVLPGAVFALSLAGWQYMLGVCVPIAVVAIAIVVINIIQSKAPRCLPKKLRNWNFLPLWMHSLEPMDNLITKTRRVCRCCCCKGKSETEPECYENPVNTADETDFKITQHK